jgi:uncharacterized membrane protein YcjF (UPF0283 family)
MALCRPVPFNPENKPGMKAVLPGLKQFISAQLDRDKSKTLSQDPG